MADLIDRDAAIYAIEKRMDDITCEEFAEGMSEAITEIGLLPSAQTGWIPVTERLPDVRQWVLCQCRAGIMDVLRMTADGSWDKNYPRTEYMSGFVLAWMPLPEPYVENNEQVRMLGKESGLCAENH